MQFIDEAPFYKIIRVTGPQHNLLGLEIALIPTGGEPEIEALDHPGDRQGPLNDRNVSEQVLLGVEDASTELARRYYVRKIQYVSTDSPPVTIYRQLTIELIRRVDASRRN
jgi:hypothetical protein